MTTTPETLERLVYRIPEVCKMLKISRATFYRMVHTRAIVVHKLGSSTFVKHESLTKALDAMTEFNPRPDPRLGVGCSETE